MLSISSIVFLFALILTTGCAANRHNQSDNCGGLNGFPPGKCQLIHNCSTLRRYIETGTVKWGDVPDCGFLNAFEGKMYCCPNASLEPTKATTPPPTFRFTGSHLVTLRYLIPITLDSYVYRCTGIILSLTHVLATSQCVGGKVVEQPNSILFGAEDAGLYDEVQIEVDVKTFKAYKNDLVLLELKTPLSSNQLSEYISIATLCDPKDLLGQPNLFAAGYSYNKQKTDSCNKFRQQLQKVNLSQCQNFQQKRHVEDLAMNQSHLCVQPGAIFQSSNQSDECSKCLIYTSSVLHVQRADGSQCVAGIATPTTDECVEDNSPLYYTDILTYAVSDFLNRIIVERNT